MGNINDKKRIAKNTIYLYVSSIFILFLGLYISRVLLQTLGIKDFGLYGVVGSIVTLLSFLNLAMSSSSSRYLTYALAKDDFYNQKRVFSAVFIVHVLLATCLFILAETVGLWYVFNKLEVPDGRLTAALWVYQSSVLVGILNIIQVPYNALITAHEKMGFSSMWNSINYMMKFLGILLMYWISFDRLIYYAGIMFFLSLIGFLVFFIYSKIHFKECSLVKFKDEQLFKGILSFAGYSAFSSSSGVVRVQGFSLFINKFFGVVMNASANIANMVSGYITNFTQNIIIAFRPQIIKCYAKGDIDEMQSNINLCVKACVALYSIIAIPICLEIDNILLLWLGKVPPLAGWFCIIGLCGGLFALVNMIMTIGIQATSKVRNNSLYITFITFLSLMIALILLFQGMKIYVVFVVNAITDFIIMGTSMWNLKRLVPRMLMRESVTLLIHLLGLITISGMFAWYVQYNMTSSLIRFILVSITYILIFGFLFWFRMLNPDMRRFLLEKLQSR